MVGVDKAGKNFKRLGDLFGDLGAFSIAFDTVHKIYLLVF